MNILRLSLLTLLLKLLCLNILLFMYLKLLYIRQGQQHSHGLTRRRVGVIIAAVTITYSEYVRVAVVIPHAKRMRRSIIYFYLWLSLLCHIFTSYLIKDKIFCKNLLDIKSVFLFSLRTCLKYF